MASNIGLNQLNICKYLLVELNLVVKYITSQEGVEAP